MADHDLIGDGCHGPVAEASTREQCIALYPGSNPGRASNRALPALAAPEQGKMPVDRALRAFRSCGIWSKDHPRARATWRQRMIRQSGGGLAKWSCTP